VPVPESADDFERRFGLHLVELYGSTDAGLPMYHPVDVPRRQGSCGTVIDAYDVRLLDDDGFEVPVGEVGELVVRPNEPSLMADRNLWFHTGDAGRFDEEGRLYFVDRLKDRIRRRGENISSYEIEQVLNEHPAVLESAAVGVRVAGAGGEEEIKAVLVLHPGAAAGFDPVALLDFCVERMPRYAVPRFVEVVDDLDKTASGKVRKQAMRDGGVTEVTWDRESVGYTIRR